MKKISKSDSEWQQELSPEAYRVCRKKGTEPPFSGEYYTHKGVGDYVCACCGQVLFRSETKYDSGSGWPSFFEPATEDAITTIKDTSHGMIREEVLCNACDAHLGHVFDDGPQPTGKRFCINSVSLQFKAKD